MRKRVLRKRRKRRAGRVNNPEATPARDALGMNKPEGLVSAQFNFDDDLNDDFLGGDAGDLENQLNNLPEPKNDFEIVAPDQDEDEDGMVDEDGENAREETGEDQLRKQLADMDMDQETINARTAEDMEETLEKERAREEAEREAKLEKRHTTIKRDLQEVYD